QIGGLGQTGGGALVVAPITASTERIDPFLPRARAQVLWSSPPRREQLARAREGDVGADARRQEQAEDEQLPQRGRLVPERDRGLRGEGATVRVEEASGVFSLCAHAADPMSGPGRRVKGRRSLSCRCSS